MEPCEKAASILCVDCDANTGQSALSAPSAQNPAYTGENFACANHASSKCRLRAGGFFRK